jgi:hypothetical protein
MGTTLGGKAGKEIATTGSGHIAPAPPATSMLPPTPAGPVPAPFPYVAKSSSAAQTSDKLTIGGPAQRRADRAAGCPTGDERDRAARTARSHGGAAEASHNGRRSVHTPDAPGTDAERDADGGTE